MGGSVEVWDVQAGTLLEVVQVPEVMDAIASPNHGLLILPCVEPRRTTVYMTKNGDCVQLSKPARSAAFLPNGRECITGGWGDGLTIWDLSTLLERQEQGLRDGVPLPNAAQPALLGTSFHGHAVRRQSSFVKAMLTRHLTVKYHLPVSIFGWASGSFGLLGE